MKLALSLLLAVAAVLLRSTECATTTEICPSENCLSPEKCESVHVGAQCNQPDATCCSVVKSEHRTHCRHFGGECMNKCNEDLQREAVDCPAHEVCCVLV